MRVVRRYPYRPSHGHVAAAKLFGIEEVPTIVLAQDVPYELTFQMSSHRIQP
jgi:hypothetical protein